MRKATAKVHNFGTSSAAKLSRDCSQECLKAIAKLPSTCALLPTKRLPPSQPPSCRKGTRRVLSHECKLLRELQRLHVLGVSLMHQLTAIQFNYHKIKAICLFYFLLVSCQDARDSCTCMRMQATLIFFQKQCHCSHTPCWKTTRHSLRLHRGHHRSCRHQNYFVDNP